MTLKPRGQEGERGAAALALLTTGIILALGIFMVMAAPLTQASDSKARSRSAADAAALAAVEAWKIDLGDLLSSEGWLGDWDDYEGLPEGAAEAAEDYAQRNGAEVVEARRDGPWTYYVKVRSTTSSKGKFAESEATATLDLPDCDTDEDPDVPMAMGLGMADEPDPEDEEPEEPALPGLILDCAGLDDIDLLPSDDGSYDLVGDIVDALLGESHAKLTS